MQVLIKMETAIVFWEEQGISEQFDAETSYGNL